MVERMEIDMTLGLPVSTRIRSRPISNHLLSTVRDSRKGRECTPERGGEAQQRGEGMNLIVLDRLIELSAVFVGCCKVSHCDCILRLDLNGEKG
jgi:hypothetical protein